MNLRRATMDDALDVLRWRNDPQTRAMSGTTGEIDRAGHLSWFGKAVTDPSRILLIGEDGGKTIGMVRLDAGEGWTVSINVAPEHRGKGYGHVLLAAALDHVSGPFIAEIRPGNEASIRLFRRCGFIERSRGDMVVMTRA